MSDPLSESAFPETRLREVLIQALDALVLCRNSDYRGRPADIDEAIGAARAVLQDRIPASPETRPAHFQCGGYLHYYDDGHTQRCDCEDCVSAVPKCKRCAGAGWFPLNPPIDGAKRIMCPVCYGNGESQKSPSSECDVLNQELRENYGDAFQVEPDDDWQQIGR